MIRIMFMESDHIRHIDWLHSNVITSRRLTRDIVALPTGVLVVSVEGIVTVCDLAVHL